MRWVVFAGDFACSPPQTARIASPTLNRGPQRIGWAPPTPEGTCTVCSTVPRDSLTITRHGSPGARDRRPGSRKGSGCPHPRTPHAPRARAAGRSDGYNPRGTRILTRHLIRTAPTPAFARAATRETLYCRVIRTSAKRPPRRQCQVNNISAQSTFVQIMRPINFPSFTSEPRSPVSSASYASIILSELLPYPRQFRLVP